MRTGATPLVASTFAALALLASLAAAQTDGAGNALAARGRGVGGDAA